MVVKKAVNSNGERLSLDLVGDGDDIDLLNDVEAAFDIKISDDELENVRNVGDLWACIKSALPPAIDGKGDRKCRQAIVFFALRSALRGRVVHRSIGLDTPLADLGVLRPLLFRRQLEQSSALRFPGIAFVTGYAPLTILGVIAMVVAWFWLPANVVALLAVCVVVSAAMWWRHRHGVWGVPNVRALVEVTARENYGRLIQRGARHTDEAARQTFWAILEDHCGETSQPITVNTALFSK